MLLNQFPPYYVKYSNITLDREESNCGSDVIPYIKKGKNAITISENNLL